MALCENILRSARGETDGLSRALVSGRRRPRRPAALSSPAPPPYHHAALIQLLDVFRAARAEFGSASQTALPLIVGIPARAARAAGAGVCESLYQAHGGERLGQQTHASCDRQLLQHARRLAAA